ncbi:CGNR zinc finger domain-containing protein [Streptomyces sp. KHY 26]|uniref:CGNR zinc finger domain-containing protein n=1 Tax=Streptomyces sp. KHY 26 TaxID=3097359 RepID=UPI00376EE817
MAHAHARLTFHGRCLLVRRVVFDRRPVAHVECAAHGCERFFLRSHGARRWCTTRCGNRVRAARAYAARRGTSP